MAISLKMIFLLFIVKTVYSFKIILTTQNDQNFSPGETLNMVCKSDTHWEFCQWRNRGENQEESEARECLMEWKRAKGGVAVQSCHEDLASRVSVTGNYEENECGLEVTGLVEEDGGIWECEMEEYKFGDWASGRKHKENFTVSVKDRTTTEQPILITRTYKTTTAMEAVQTTEEVKEETTTLFDVEEVEDFTEMNQTPIEAPLTQVFTENLIALAVEEEKSREDSVGQVAGITVAVIALLVGLVVGGVFWNRKRRSINVVSLQKLKDDEESCTNAIVEAEVSMSDLMDREK